MNTRNSRAAIGVAVLAMWVSASGGISAQSIIAPSSSGTPTSMPVPKYLLYRHFLAWVRDLDKKSAAAGVSDPYAFAAPLRHASPVNSELDTLRSEAKQLEADLAIQDAQLKQIIAAYRSSAQPAAKLGGALPPLPAEMQQAQAGRTGLLVQHMIRLQTALGPEASARLDAYLQHDFAPHVSLKPLKKPRAFSLEGAQVLGGAQQ